MEYEPTVLTLSELLREARLRRGLSKRALSQKAGLSASYVGKLEAGLLEPSVHAFSVLALALELTSVETLFCIRVAYAEVRRSDAGRSEATARIIADDRRIAGQRRAVNL